MRLVPWALTWILGVLALQKHKDPKTNSHRCVSKDQGVSDQYCEAVKCDERFSKFCVWLDSPQGYNTVANRQEAAMNGRGSQDVLNSVIDAFGKSHSDRPEPRHTASVASVAQEDELKKTYASCWVPTAWYPKHQCGQPDPVECSRGWSVYTDKNTCCQPGAAFTKGCDGYVTSLKIKDKIISDVLSGDPRVAQDEARWLRDMTLQKERRESMMKFGYDPSGKHHQNVSPGAGGVVRKPGVPVDETEVKPGPIPPFTSEVKPPDGKDLKINTGVYFTVTPHSSIPPLMSKKDFNEMFPFANFHTEPPIYTYENFINATAYFPSFAGTGDVNTRKRELAAFLAHISQETSGWWSGQDYTWGLTFNREPGCGESRDACHLYQACNTKTPYKCHPGKHYYGRGPMMISWNYNYGECSNYLFGDDRMLTDPDLLANSGKTGFMSALWFWMEPHGGYGKPSSHDAITKLWKPTHHDQVSGRKAGFGLTLNIVDGGNVCLKDKIPVDAEHRINYYLRYCKVLKVSPGPHINCKAQIPFITDWGTPVEVTPDVNTDELKPGSQNTIHTMGDRSYHITAIHSLPDAASIPFDKYKFLQSGRKCDENSRIMLECGDCGPGLTDFNSCKSMCDAHLQCRYFNYFNDKACSLYTDCVSTEIDNRSVIYLKQSHLRNIGPSSVAGTFPAVAIKPKIWNDEKKVSKKKNLELKKSSAMHFKAKTAMNKTTILPKSANKHV